MRDLYLIRCLCVFSVWLFSLGVAFGQQIDTTAYHELSGVEVVEKVRPSVTREGTPLQIMDRAGIDRLGVQDLSEAVKRFSGVTVQDYGGIGGLKTYRRQLRWGDDYGCAKRASRYQPFLVG